MFCWRISCWVVLGYPSFVVSPGQCSNATAANIPPATVSGYWVIPGITNNTGRQHTMQNVPNTFFEFIYTFSYPLRGNVCNVCEIYKLIYFARAFVSMTISDMDTTVRVSTDTRDKLVEIGKKNESYDSLILRLIEYYLQKEKK